MVVDDQLESVISDTYYITLLQMVVDDQLESVISDTY